MKHDLNNAQSYEHLMGSPKPSHLGSQSMGHLAGGNAGYKPAFTAPEHNPGGATNVKSKKGAMPESKGPGGMDM